MGKSERLVRVEEEVRIGAKSFQELFLIEMGRNVILDCYPVGNHSTANIQFRQGNISLRMFIKKKLNSFT